MSNKTAAILAGAALLAGGLIGRASADTGGGHPSTAKPAPAIGQGLDPKAYPRTKQGAATAAQAYDDALLQAVFSTPEERRTVVDTISSQAMRDQITKDEDQSVAIYTKAFDLPRGLDEVVLRVAPLGWRVVTFTNDSARVETWTIAVGGKPGVGNGIVSNFKTSTIDLVWERGAWRLAGSPQGKDGPTPVADNPEAGAQLLTAVRDMQEFTHVAR
jgi:hypothetical protein